MDDLVEFFAELVFDVLLASCEESARGRRIGKIVCGILLLACIVFTVLWIWHRGVTHTLALVLLVAIPSIVFLLK
jgi:heme/copper-type cytochrome/quinol oxidase subunit 4